MADRVADRLVDLEHHLVGVEDDRRGPGRALVRPQEGAVSHRHLDIAFDPDGFLWFEGRLDDVIAKLTTFPEAVSAGKVKVAGNPMRLGELMMLMDEFPRMFEIVEPKRTVIS